MPPECIPGVFWLLLPVAAASGWYVARRGKPIEPRQVQRNDHASAYFKGLNYLLNEQPDKAIEVLLKTLENQGEAVETHLALGNLFRRRGEVDRAIRIHQHLVAQSFLSKEQRNAAMLELGMDYTRSGLLDRAEALFQELLTRQPDPQQALRQLLEISQLEQDWDNALEYARRLENITGERLGKIIAHFYCEKAAQASRLMDDGAATAWVRAALAADPQCARASFMEADLAYRAGQYEDAMRAYQRVEHQDPELLPEAAGPMLDCAKRLGRLDQFSASLERLSEKYGSVVLALCHAELLASQRGYDQAFDYLCRELRKYPSMRGLDKLLEFFLATADAPSRQRLGHLKEISARLLGAKSAYKCRHCGFVSKTLYWQCPGCKYWGAVKPAPGLEVA
jgi:lipopolysaccharide biosynthesis regulator YciM